jgi:ribonuclease BN (tRNA processing enzyme)
MKKKTTGLKVYGPPGLKEYLFTVLKVTNTGYNRKFEINPVELNANQSLRVGNCKVSAFQMDHTLPCLGYRLEDDRLVVAYTGDTQPCEGSSLLARDANLLIHEATYLQADLEKASSSKHSTSKQGAEAASSAGAKKLVLTHILETSETPEQMIAEARSVFGETTIASDGMEVAL